MTLIYQIISTGILCFVCTTLGILYALPSSTLKLFSSENTPLDRVMTETELSLMGSISAAGTLVVTPFSGYLLDTFGRKRILILFCLPQMFGWLLSVTIFRVEAFIFSMFLTGVGNCIFLATFIYINEFCKPSIRGILSSTATIFNGIGVLISYLLGGTLEYNTLNYTGLTLSVAGLVMICFLKESPLYLVKKGFEEEAARSIAFFKGTKSTSERVVKEIENIRRIINADIEIRITPEEVRLKPEENKPVEKLSIRRYLMKSRSSRRALITLLVLYALCLFQGQVVVQMFAGPLFEAAVPSMTATLSTVLFAIITIVAGCFGAYISDKAGRRILSITASIGTGLFCVILATNIQWQWAPSWVTAVFIYFYTFTGVLGASTVPNILLGELFLPEIKGFATTICIEWAYICNFIMLYMFIPLFNAYGLGPLFYFFGGFSVCTAIFSFIYIPETKNLPTDVIQQKFLKRIKY